jgi:hypothetical protein
LPELFVHKDRVGLCTGWSLYLPSLPFYLLIILQFKYFERAGENDTDDDNDNNNDSDNIIFRDYYQFWYKEESDIRWLGTSTQSSAHMSKHVKGMFLVNVHM